MKKKLLSLVLAVCLIIPCAFMMTACGKKAYSISGKTLEYTDRVKVVWKDGATDAEKSAFLANFGENMTEETLANQFKERFAKISISMKFKKDGSVVMTQSSQAEDGTTKSDENTYYYSQSKDKKEIKIYDEKEFTAETEADGVILFMDGSFYVSYGDYDANATANILIKLKKK